MLVGTFSVFEVRPQLPNIREFSKKTASNTYPKHQDRKYGDHDQTLGSWRQLVYMGLE